MLWACSTESNVEQEEPALPSLQSKSITFEVDPEIGGRVASFRFKGQEVLAVDRDPDHLHWGSTVWPSPQEDWSWPPPLGVDRKPYQIKEQTPDKIRLESTRDAYKNIQVSKTFTLQDEHTVLLTYTFKNNGDSSIQVGIWENSRIPYAGEIQWRSGPLLPDTTAGLQQDTLHSRLVLGKQPRAGKLFIDSPVGRIHYRKDSLLWIKRFELTPSDQVAPNQAAIELYYDPPRGFAEIEVQGPYTLLEAGAQTSYSVQWSLATTSD